MDVVLPPCSSFSDEGRVIIWRAKREGRGGGRGGGKRVNVEAINLLCMEGKGESIMHALYGNITCQRFDLQ